MDDLDDLDTYAIANLCIMSISEFSTLNRSVLANAKDAWQSPMKGLSQVQLLDTYAQFRIWTDDVGALQEDEASLDCRIQLSDIYDEVFRLLKELVLTLSQLTVTISGKQDSANLTAWVDQIFSGDEYSYSKDIFEQLAVYMKSCVKGLLRLTTVINTSSRYTKFARGPNKDVYDTTQDIAYASECLLGSGDTSALQRKLGKANTCRRQWLSSVNKRHLNSLYSVSFGHFGMTRSISSKGKICSMMRWTSLIYFDGGWIKPTDDVLSEKKNESKSTTSLLSDKVFSKADRLPGSMDNTAGELIKISRLPAEAIMREPFRCSVCLEMITIKDVRAWRKHVHADLASYICTFDNCTNATFKDRKEWFRHEMEFHRRDWRCIICSVLFPARATLEAHISDTHSDIVSTGHIGHLLDNSSMPVQSILASVCPFCSPNTTLSTKLVQSKDATQIRLEPNRFQRHLGSHLEQFALSVLPSNILDFVRNEEHQENEDEEEEEEEEEEALQSSRTKDIELEDLANRNSVFDKLIANLEIMCNLESQEPLTCEYDSISALAPQWQPPHHFTPPKQDFLEIDPCFIPRRQQPATYGNEFTPEWFRGHDENMEAFCGRCKENNWFRISSGDYEYHQAFTHGLLNTGQRLPSPKRVHTRLDISSIKARSFNTIEYLSDSINLRRLREIVRCSAGFAGKLRPNHNLAGLILSRDSSMKNLIHYAAEEGNVSALEYLFQTAKLLESTGIFKEALNQQSCNGWTPLMLAVGQGHEQAAALLLEQGADADLISKKGFTALDVAALAGYHSVARLLLRNGAKVHDAKAFQEVYMYLGERPTLEEDISSFSLSVGVGDFDWTPMMRLSSQNNVPALKILLQTTENTEATASDARTAFMIALTHESFEAAQLLRDCGTNVDMRNGEGKTALMLAARSGQEPVIQHLLLLGANINFQAEDGWTAVTECAAGGRPGILSILIKHGASLEMTCVHEWTLLMHACYHNNEECVKILLEAGAKIRYSSPRGDSPLLLAAAAGYSSIVRLLLKRGALPEVPRVTPKGEWEEGVFSDQYSRRMPRRHTAMSIERRKKINGQCWTPLMVACQNGHLDVVKELILAGAGSETLSPYGRNVFEIAEENGHNSIISILDKGYDTSQSVWRRTWAEEIEHQERAKLGRPQSTYMPSKSTYKPLKGTRRNLKGTRDSLVSARKYSSSSEATSERWWKWTDP